MKQGLKAFLALGILLALAYLALPYVFKNPTWPSDRLLTGPSVFFANYSKGLIEQGKTHPQCKYPFVTPLPTMSAAIFFGYKDSRPERFVGDLLERTVLAQKLLSPCQTEREILCQFKRSAENGDRFHRKVNDQNFEIFLSHSSLTFDDEFNRELSAQREWSQLSQTNFLESLRQGHIVFYDGHSRDGGGPDFDPPLLLPNGKVDYKYYEKAQPYFQQMLKALSQRGPKRLLLGLFSCASLQHFSKDLLAQDIDLISSRDLLYYADALENLVAGLEHVFSGACEKDLRQALKEKTPGIGSQLTRGFKK